MIDIEHSVFVAGTDTGVGKTQVALALLRQLGASGRRVAAMKPVAAGAIETSHGLRNDDALDLAAAASVRLPYDWVNPCCLPDPTSPHLAAARAGRPIDIDLIESAYRHIAAQAEIVVVEGAGGWWAPLGEPQQPGETGPTMADIAIRLRLPVLLVVGIRLGCLNHALLTCAAIRDAGLDCAGWVANHIDPAFPNAEDYVASLSRRLPVRCVGRLAYDASSPADRLC